ncbi:MAG: PD40 domain-containing protein [Pyrinomonadaceae bacterium]|nr:PD40 domain-containing protein [Pyrinomonadaceae bacterium]
MSEKLPSPKTIESEADSRVYAERETMGRENVQQIKEIFNAALERAPGERAQFLAEECAGDDETRRAVENLLSSLESAGDSLKQPAIAKFAELAADDSTQLQNGQIVSHYKILEFLSAGGMGEVYLAQDVKLNRRVALKLLPLQFTSDAQRAHRFEQEAQAASALNHPNIITIYEIGEMDNNSHFIAAEYIEGATLRQHIAREKFNLREILEIAIQTASALAAAHAAGIIHRDIKPENIMLRPDALVKILDFGLAKLTEIHRAAIDGESPTLIKNSTESGMILGTVRYMSPEQARGLSVDARTDIFSLGVVLYEMITGQAPFAGESNADTLAAILNKDQLPFAHYSLDVPQELQRIVGKMLRKERDERYQTMKDALGDLKDLRNELQMQDRRERSSANMESHHATLAVKTTQDATAKGSDESEARTTVNATQISSQNKSRRRGVAIALGLVLTVLLAAGVWLFRARQNSFSTVSVQKVAQITSWSGLDDFPSMSPDGNAVAYCSDHNGSFEIYVKQLTPGAKEIQLTADGGQNFQPAWSPDGQRIAYYSKQRGGIWVIPASGGEARQITDFGSHPAWSPDGKQIAFQSYPLNDLGAYARNALSPSTLWLVAANGGEPKQLTQIGNPPGGHGSPSFSPDGKRIVFEVDDYINESVWTISINGDDAKQITQKGSYEPVYAPDGKSILYTLSGVYQVRVNPDTNEPVGEPSQIAGIGGVTSAVRRVSFSADGKRIAYSALTRRESLSSIRLQINSSEVEGAPVPLVQNTNERSNFPTFSPDGKRIAFTSCNVGGTGCDIWLMNADGSNQIQLTTNESGELMPSWFPDMQQVAYISKRTGHWTLWAINLNTKREKMLLDLTDDIYARLSPDGKQIVFTLTRNGGVINVWTASLAGGEPKQLTFDKEMMGFPAWSPDGKYIALQMKRGDDTHIMIMPSAGGTPEQLTFDKGQSWIYAWSPDGDKILFAGFRNGLWNVRWVSRSTKKQQQLTNYTKLNSFVRYPSWSPKGDQIVYEYSETTGNIWVADLK